MNAKCKICKKEFYASGDRYVEPYCSPQCYAQKKKKKKVRISIKKIKQTSGAIKKRLHSHNCLRCKTKTATATHHIVYKSEAPRHKNLHNERNLIDLCYDCHIEWYHAKKDRREHLIKKRKLWELFPKKIQKYNP